MTLLIDRPIEIECKDSVILMPESEVLRLSLCDDIGGWLSDEYTKEEVECVKAFIEDNS